MKLPNLRNFSLALLTTGLLLAGAPIRAQAAPVAEQEAPTAADLLPHGVLAEDGTLIGGQPTAEQLEAIREAGFKTVVDMRMPEEEGSTRTDIEGTGMTYIAMPIAGSTDMTEENARALAKILESAERPIVLHCASGNRVGGLLALKAFYLDGVAPEEALKLGKAMGMTRTEGAVRERLGLPPLPPAEPKAPAAPSRSF